MLESIYELDNGTRGDKFTYESNGVPGMDFQVERC